MPVLEKIKTIYEDVQNFLKEARECEKNSEEAIVKFKEAFEFLEELHELISQHHGTKDHRYEDVCVQLCNVGNIISLHYIQAK
jgi:hypothetical protein